MITHDEALSAIFNANLVGSKSGITLENYITQQEKVSKLLGLYQEKDRLNPYSDNWGSEFDDIVRQIRELERELNE